MSDVEKSLITSLRSTVLSKDTFDRTVYDKLNVAQNNPNIESDSAKKQIAKIRRERVNRDLDYVLGLPDSTPIHTQLDEVLALSRIITDKKQLKLLSNKEQSLLINAEEVYGKLLRETKDADQLRVHVNEYIAIMSISNSEGEIDTEPYIRACDDDLLLLTKKELSLLDGNVSSDYAILSRLLPIPSKSLMKSTEIQLSNSISDAAKLHNERIISKANAVLGKLTSHKDNLEQLKNEISQLATLYIPNDDATIASYNDLLVKKSNELKEVARNAVFSANGSVSSVFENGKITVNLTTDLPDGTVFHVEYWFWNMAGDAGYDYLGYMTIRNGKGSKTFRMYDYMHGIDIKLVIVLDLVDSDGFMRKAGYSQPKAVLDLYKKYGEEGQTSDVIEDIRKPYPSADAKLEKSEAGFKSALSSIISTYRKWYPGLVLYIEKKIPDKDWDAIDVVMDNRLWNDLSSREQSDITTDISGKIRLAAKNNGLLVYPSIWFENQMSKTLKTVY